MSPQQKCIIRSVEDTLSRSQKFRLPGKKKLLEPEHEIEIVVVDVTGSPVERPKKNKNSFPVARINDIPLKHKLS